MATFRIKNNAGLKLALQQYRNKSEHRFQIALDNWGELMTETIGESLLAVGAFDQGQTHAATHPEPTLKIGTELVKRVVNEAAQASVIEHGRGPRKGSPPPTIPLVGWAHRKGMLSALPVNVTFDGRWAKKWAAAFAIHNRNKAGGSGSGKSKKSKEPLDPEIRDMLIVLGIRRKIFEKGIKGRFPFRKAYEIRRKTFVQDIAVVVRSAA